MESITVEISQQRLTGMLGKVRCASQQAGALSDPGKLLIKVAKGHLITHVQSRQIIATAWEKIENLDPAASDSVVVDFAKIFQIANSHDVEDTFTITMKDPSYIILGSNIGTWKLITDDRQSYEAMNFKGDKCGEVEVLAFNKMVTAAGVLADTSKKSAIDSGVRMYHMYGALHMFFATGSEAAILRDELKEPFTSDFDVFIKSWVLKEMKLPGKDKAKVSVNKEEELMIFECDNTKIVISVSTDESMNWDDATSRMNYQEPGERSEYTRLNKLALKASIARLSKVSEGTLDIQVLGKEQANIHSQLKAGDRGDEKMTVFSGVSGKENADPTKTTLRLSMAILKSLTSVDTDVEDLELEYQVNEDTGIASIAMFSGQLTKTKINVQVVFPVGV